MKYIVKMGVQGAIEDTKEQIKFAIEIAMERADIGVYWIEVEEI